MKRAGGPAFDWAVRFNERVREALASRDHQALSEFERLDEDARLAVPTPEHYLPLLYIAALQREDEQMSFAVDGYEIDRKSTRLNSSHSQISYAVFCLKKKKINRNYFHRNHYGS